MSCFNKLIQPKEGHGSLWFLASVQKTTWPCSRCQGLAWGVGCFVGVTWVGNSVVLVFCFESKHSWPKIRCKTPSLLHWPWAPNSDNRSVGEIVNNFLAFVPPRFQNILRKPWVTQRAFIGTQILKNHFQTEFQKINSSGQFIHSSKMGVWVLGHWIAQERFLKISICVSNFPHLALYDNSFHK